MRKVFVASVLVATAVGASVALAASGTLELAPPWGGADQDPSDENRVVVTYEVKASGNIPQSTVAAVEDGIAAWNAAIDGRESGWDFDLVPAGSGTSSTTGGSRPYHHKPGHGGGGGGNGGGGSAADITIQLKKGGGVIAGSAQRTLDGNGFVVAVKIQISGSSFGLPNDDAVVTEITEHELGHALALGHHSNEQDLMGRTVGYEGGGPSACDLDGFVEAHEWLTDGDPSTGPSIVAAGSIDCA